VGEVGTGIAHAVRRQPNCLLGDWRSRPCRLVRGWAGAGPPNQLACLRKGRAGGPWGTASAASVTLLARFLALDCGRSGCDRTTRSDVGGARRSTGSQLDGLGADDLPGRLERYEVRARFQGPATGSGDCLTCREPSMGSERSSQVIIVLNWEYSRESVRFLYREVDI
jgi:hypothetical protein